MAKARTRLGHARSFAYRGSVDAAEPSAMRPGPPAARHVTVDGAVRLPQSITRDVAVDDRGGAVETVTSGSTVWSRTAPSVDALAATPWEAAALTHALDVGSPDRLGMALLADVLRAAGDRQRDGTDAAGRRHALKTCMMLSERVPSANGRAPRDSCGDVSTCGGGRF